MTRKSKTETPTMRSTVLSPAKINLFLRIISKRPDGYHNIYSLMQPVSLYDELDISINDKEGIKVVADLPGVPDGPENLAYRAAELMLDKSGKKSGIEIIIRKKIPHGAGLGGGSSNAATVLMALNGLLNAGLTLEQLMSLGGLLGSDVPFFMLKSSAFATGVGTDLKLVVVPKYHYVLINPGFTVSTEWVYTSFHLTNRAEDNNLIYSDDSLNDICWLTSSMVNELESVTARGHPQVNEIKDSLKAAGAEATLMSGSGPTVFGVFSGEASAAKAVLTLREVVSSKYSLFHVHGL